MSTDDLTALAARTAGALWGEIVRAFQRVRERIIADALAQAVLARNAETVVEQVALTDLTNALADLQTKIAPVRAASWENATPKGLSHPLLRETLGANALRRPESLQAIARADLARIQGITRETQEAIRAILAKGLENGTHPTTLARQIREQVGLTRQGVARVAKYRAKLEGEGRKPAMVNRMVASKTKALIAERAKLIATTEVARARGEGQRMQWERMVADGILKSEEWRQEWVTAHDEIVQKCPICRPMDGQRVRIGEPFISPVGPLANAPAHPRCRCIARLVAANFRVGQPTAPARDAILANLGRLGTP